MQWNRLDPEKTENLIASIKNAGGPALFTAQNSEAKSMRLPFFNGILLYRITNNSSLPIFSMDFLGNGERFFYLDGSYTPIEKAKALSDFTIEAANIAAYLQFYFFYVFQEDGEIYPVFRTRPLPELDAQQFYHSNQTVPDAADQFEIEAKNDDIFRVSLCLYYDGSLMRAFLDVNASGDVKITSLKPLFGEGADSVRSGIDEMNR